MGLLSIYMIQSLVLGCEFLIFKIFLLFCEGVWCRFRKDKLFIKIYFQELYSKYGSEPACCWIGFGFEFGHHGVILKMLKLVPSTAGIQIVGWMFWRTSLLWTMKTFWQSSHNQGKFDCYSNIHGWDNLDGRLLEVKRGPRLYLVKIFNQNSRGVKGRGQITVCPYPVDPVSTSNTQ